MPSALGKAGSQGPTPRPGPGSPEGHGPQAERAVWEGAHSLPLKSPDTSAAQQTAHLPLGVRVHSLWEAAQDLASLSPGSEANYPDTNVAVSRHFSEGEGRARQWAEALGARGSSRSPLPFQTSGSWVGSGSSHGLAFPPLSHQSSRVSASMLTGRCGQRAGPQPQRRQGRVCPQSPAVSAPSAQQ